MIIYEDSTSQTKTMRALARNADEVLISTYGVYAGIQKDGVNIHDWAKPEIHSYTQDFLNDCPDNTTIVVGLAEFKPCKVDCEFCAKKERDYMTRADKHKEHFDRFNWIFTSEHHMKAVCIRKGEDWNCFIGGRNLSDSNFTDMGVQLNGLQGADIAKSVKRQLQGVLNA